MGATKLHLGCGSERKPGWVNVDFQARLNPDQVVDLSVFPWPWPDNSVDEIYSHHVFEHLPATVATMMECHRILKPGGTVEVIVPDACNRAYFQDPTHFRPWTDATVNYFLNGHFSKIYSDKGFDLVFCHLRDQGKFGMNWMHRVRNIVPRFIRMPLRFVLLGMFDEVHFKLRKP
jgi:SAM-dependent methyltransferase